MIGVKKISYVCYDTSELERLETYYTTILGMRVSGAASGERYLAHTIDHHSVVLRESRSSGCSGVGVQIGPNDDLDEFERQVRDCGLQTDRRHDAQLGVAEQITFKDPKGTLIDVFNLPELVGGSYGLNGIAPNKLGHVAFHVTDVVEMTDFYCNVLDFRVSDWLQRRFSFLRCGSDHHTVNFIQSGSIRHDHTAFELRDWPHMELACDFLSRNGYRLIWGPGRHGIGHNLFTYHRNPDGLIVELYAELDRMSDESLGYFDPRPWHPDIPQRPKTWMMTPGLVNLWKEEFPPKEMLEV